MATTIFSSSLRIRRLNKRSSSTTCAAKRRLALRVVAHSRVARRNFDLRVGLLGLECCEA